MCMKVSEKELRKIISEAIEKYIGQVDTNDSAFDIGLGIMGNFKISPRLMSAIYEAAFQILGYERFAINGEIVGDNSVMDNPWDDAYSILEWAIQNKDLDEVKFTLSVLSIVQFGINSSKALRLQAGIISGAPNDSSFV